MKENQKQQKDQIQNKEITKIKKEIDDRYVAIEELKNKSPFGNKPELYALIDLFVEKDILVLNKRVNRLKVSASFYTTSVFIVFVLAVSIAYGQMFDSTFDMSTFEWIKNSQTTKYSNENIVLFWTSYIPVFVKSFTFYGLLILLGATLWKHAKANLDQAERLLSKRRANRLLRIFLHIKEDINIDDFEKILSLVDNKNAFTDIKAEAKAPWGNVISDLIKSQTEIIKSLSKKNS